MKRYDLCGEYELYICELSRGDYVKYEDHLAALAQAVPEWQPIETAPKDGRTLLLGKRTAMGRWRTMRGQWFTQELINEEWENPDDAEVGWYETAVEPDDPLNCWATSPTHWMPLPVAPKPTGGK